MYLIWKMQKKGPIAMLSTENQPFYDYFTKFKIKFEYICNIGSAEKLEFDDSVAHTALTV